jgi:hypothetical protein
MALGLGIGSTLASSLVTTGLQDITSGSAAGLRLWLKNNTNVTASSWRDSSGYDNHATQGTEANQASVSGGGLDFESARVSGNDPNGDFYNLANKITIQENGGFCIAMVVTREDNAIGTILGEGSAELVQFRDTNTFQIRTANGGGTTNVDFAGDPFGTGSKFLFLINRTAGVQNKFTFFRNGTALTPNVDTSTNEAQGENPGLIALDVLGGNVGYVNYFDGIIHEIALWNRALNTTEIADVNSFFTSYHGL